MEPFYLKATETTPEINFDLEKNVFSIKGKSVFLHVDEFYDPILEWLKNLDEFQLGAWFPDLPLEGNQDPLKLALLKKAMNRDDPIGMILFLQRNTRACNTNRGTLSIIKNLYTYKAEAESSLEALAEEENKTPASFINSHLANDQIPVALRTQARKGDTERVIKLMQQDPNAANHRSHEHGSALDGALKKNHLRTAIVLIKAMNATALSPSFPSVILSGNEKVIRAMVERYIELEAYEALNNDLRAMKKTTPGGFFQKGVSSSKVNDAIHVAKKMIRDMVKSPDISNEEKLQLLNKILPNDNHDAMGEIIRIPRHLTACKDSKGILGELTEIHRQVARPSMK